MEREVRYRDAILIATCVHTAYGIRDPRCPGCFKTLYHSEVERPIMKRAKRTGKLRGYPERSTREEREERSPIKRVERGDDTIKRAIRGTWKITPRAYSRLLTIIAELEIYLGPLDETGEAKRACSILRKLERSSIVRWGVQDDKGSSK